MFAHLFFILELIMKKKKTEKSTSEKEVIKQKSTLAIKDNLISTINKSYGYEVILTDNEKATVKKEPIDIFSIDVETKGGIPRGRGVIIEGEESVFKSSLMYKIGGAFQRICGNCMEGHITESNFKKVKIILDKKSNENVIYVKGANGNKDCYYSKKYFATLKEKRNIYCPKEKIAVKNGTYLYSYDIKCSHCTEGSYSLFGILDAEHNYTKKWARKFGVVNFYTAVCYPEYSEQTGDVLREWLSTGRLSIIGVDSVDAIAPKIEDTSSMEDQQMGVQARVWNKITRAIHSKLNHPFSYSYTTTDNKKVSEEKRPEPTICLLSQIREKIGIAYGSPLVTGGGRGKKYLSSLTFRLSKGERDFEKKGNERLYLNWQKFNFELIKSKVCAPNRIGNFHFNMRTLEIENEVTIVDYAIKHKIINASGAWYQYKDIKQQGKEKLVDYLKSNPKILEEIKKEVIKVL